MLCQRSWRAGVVAGHLGPPAEVRYLSPGRHRPRTRDLFSHSSLTQWDVALFGTDYDLVSAKLEFESYFSDTFLQLSGFSVGYRKDGVRRVEWGHMFSGSLFRDFDAKVFAVKVGAGAEWGHALAHFRPNRVRVCQRRDRSLSTHLHASECRRPLRRDHDRRDGLPVRRSEHRAAAGVPVVRDRMRIGITRFNFDDFEVSPTDSSAMQPVRSASWSPTSSPTSVSGCSEVRPQWRPSRRAKPAATFFHLNSTWASTEQDMARVRRGKNRVENRRTHARLFDDRRVRALLDSDAGMQVAGRGGDVPHTRPGLGEAMTPRRWDAWRRAPVTAICR